MLRVGITLFLCAFVVAHVAEHDSIEDFLLSRPGADETETALVQELADEATANKATVAKAKAKSKAAVVFFSLCENKGGSKSFTASGDNDLTWAQSLSVPKGLCAQLFQQKGLVGKFVKITGPATVKCLKNVALSSPKTTAKNWAKQVRSLRITKCAPLTAAEKAKQIKVAAAAEIKAATKNAYKGGKSLKSISDIVRHDILKSAGKVKTGKASKSDAAKAKAAAKGLPLLAGASMTKAGATSKVLDPLAKRISVCADKPGFKDGKGRDCAEYTKIGLKQGLCKKFGAKKYGGKTASDHCCACGGGTKGKVPALPSKSVKGGKKHDGVGPAPVSKNWYTYSKHSAAWKKFVVPYPKFDAKDVKTWRTDGMPDDDKDKGKVNSAGVNSIDGGVHIVRDPHKGFVSQDASLGPGGHYYIGRRRRRIGAGFARRRRTKKTKRYVVRRRSAMPSVGITSAKLTGPTPRGKPRCTHMKLKYKRKWPYCRKLQCFGGRTLKQVKKSCRKNGLCIGFTYDHGLKKNGGGCMLAPPCQFFGSITYDYYVKDFKCPKKPRVKDYKRPKRVAPLGGYSSGATHTTKAKPHALENVDKHTKELAKVMHKDLAKDVRSRTKTTKSKKMTEAEDCAKCVAEFVKAGGCHRYKVEKKDPSFLIPKGCSSCAKKCIASCHVKGYNSKVTSSAKAKKVLAKKLKKELKKPASLKKKVSINRTYASLKKEAAKDAKEVADTKNALEEGKIRAMENKIAKKVTPWAKKTLESNEEATAKAKKAVAEDMFVEAVDKA